MVDVGDVVDGLQDLGGDLVDAIKEKAAEGWDPYPEEAGKAGQVKFACQKGVSDECGYIRRLEKDLATTIYWSGSPCLDYLFFVANWHPFLGIFLSHPNHPWTKRQRVSMFLISAAITIVPAAVIARRFAMGRIATLTPYTTFIVVTIPDIIVGFILYHLSVIDTYCPICDFPIKLVRQTCFCIAIFFAEIAAGKFFATSS